MSFSVNTNAGAFTALQNLGTSDRLLATTQARINTGLKVASAKDSAAIYSIAQSMRANVSGYNAVNSSLDRAQSELDIAIAGAEAISDLLIEMKEKAVAAKDAGLDAASRTALNDEFQELLSQVDSIANNAVFNGTNLLTGDSLSAITNADGSETISASVSSLTAADLGIDTADISTAGTGTPNTLVPTGYTTPINSGDALSALNNYMDANFNSLYNNGALYDQSTGDFTNSGGADSADQVAFALGTDMGVSPGVLVSSGSFIFIDSGSLYIEGSGASATFTASPTSSGGGASGAVDSIEAAIETVNTTLSTLGATSNRLAIQKQFTGQLSDGLEVGIGNLVDADMAVESANLTAIQTKQQLGLQALSIANQAPQSVLSLFR